MGDISYEQLFDTLRRERSRDELQELEEDFFAQAKSYLSIKEDELRASDVFSSSGDQLRTQVNNARRMLKELYDRRERKIALLALNKARTNSGLVDTSSLTSMEGSLFDQLVQTLTSQRSSMIPKLTPPSRTDPLMPTKTASKPSVQPAKSSSEPKKEENIVHGGMQIRITSSVPKFMGSATESFGPYEQGKVVELPERIAKVLIKKGRAENA